MYIFPLNHYHFLETAPSLNLCHPILFIYFPNSQNCLISPNNMFYPDMTSLLSILHEEGPQGVMRPNFLQPSINQLEKIPKVLNSAFFPAVKHIGTSFNCFIIAWTLFCFGLVCTWPNYSSGELMPSQ